MDALNLNTDFKYAIDRRQPVTHKSARLILRLEHEPDRQYLYLSNLASKITRNGHATELLSHVCSFADLKKLDVRLAVEPFGLNPDKTAAELIVFYSKFGFERVDTAAIRPIMLRRFRLAE